MKMLETAQNTALRCITGQARTTPLEALRVESGIDSYKTMSKRLCAKAYVKAKCLPPDHPKHIAAFEKTKHRLHRSNFRSKAEEIRKELPAAVWNLEPTAQTHCSRWSRNPTPLTISSTIPTVSKNGNPSANKVAAEDPIELFQAATTIYTDGSATAGTTNGGAAAIISTGPPRDPVIKERLLRRGSLLTSSYEEEKRALQMALEWLETNNQEGNVLICSDIQALIRAMISRSPEVEKMRERMEEFNNLSLQWIPGHCDVKGNEAADEAAKEAATMTVQPAATSRASALSCINRYIVDPPISHDRKATIYGNLKRSKEEQVIESRSDAVRLAQLRSGHCPKLAAYRCLMHRTVDPVCQKCMENPQTLEHWLVDCPALAQLRMRIFGSETVTLEDLSRRPAECVRMPRLALE